MAIKLEVQLTADQQTLMTTIARDVLGEQATGAEMIDWATEVARQGLAAEVQRVALADIDTDARASVNAARREFLAAHRAAWGSGDDGD